jgi:hypothetical protein
LPAALLSADERGALVILKIVGLDTDYQSVGTNTLWQGQLNGVPRLNERSVTLEIVNEFWMWKKKSLRKSSASCPWQFKGAECAYTGAGTWCDQGYARCTALGNTDNYGGFRFIPSIAEREIWWGRGKP